VTFGYCCFVKCSASKGFFYSNIIKKGGAIYITWATAPILSNCVFSNNKTSSSDFRNDVVYNSDNNNAYSIKYYKYKLN
jgi:hypothetical protein